MFHHYRYKFDGNFNRMVKMFQELGEESSEGYLMRYEKFTKTLSFLEELLEFENEESVLTDSQRNHLKIMRDFVNVGS